MKWPALVGKESSQSKEDLVLQSLAFRVTPKYRSTHMSELHCIVASRAGRALGFSTPQILIWGWSICNIVDYDYTIIRLGKHLVTT